MHSSPHAARLLSALSFSVLAGGAGVAAAAPGGPAPVVGGTDAAPGAWPDAVSVMYADGGGCTGTLIAPDVVLTAGHCIEYSPTAIIANTVDYDGPGGERIAVTRAMAHPGWEGSYDVGVLVLARPATTAPRPAATSCVFEQQFAVGAAVELVGFGATDLQGESFNSRLRQVTASVRDPDCSGGDGCVSSISPGGEFVAGGMGIGSCFGDSGGPVYRTTPWGTYVVGVVSRGVDSGRDPCGGGGIYVRTDAVLDWVEQATGRTVLRGLCGACLLYTSRCV